MLVIWLWLWLFLFYHHKSLWQGKLVLRNSSLMNWLDIPIHTFISLFCFTTRFAKWRRSYAAAPATTKRKMDNSWFDPWYFKNKKKTKLNKKKDPNMTTEFQKPPHSNFLGNHYDPKLNASFHNTWESVGWYRQITLYGYVSDCTRGRTLATTGCIQE